MEHYTSAWGIDAVILADPGLMRYANEHHPDLRLHLSVQGSATNADAINLYQQQFSRQLGEEVEVEQPLFMEKAQLLLVMLLLGKVSQARGALGRW